MASSHFIPFDLHLKVIDMKYVLLFFSFLVFSSAVHSQNLVPNPSFEDYSECPVFPGEISQAIGWSSYGGSPDYFNSCANGANPVTVGTPANNYGFQHPADGFAYIGLYTFYSTPPDYREFVGVELLENLSIGGRYCLSFDISLGLNMITTDCANGGFGAKLSTTPFSSGIPIPIDNTPAVYSDMIISDTSNWTTFSLQFIADSGYTFLALGNFFNNANTDTVQYDDGNNVGRGYYYLDNLSLVRCDTAMTVDSEVSAECKVWPNPVENELNVLWPNGIKELRIYNTLGECLLLEEFRQFQEAFSKDLVMLKSGIYYVSIKAFNNSIYTHKLIKP